MPTHSIMLHDTRLSGQYHFPSYDRVRSVNAYTSLRWAMLRVKGYARHHGKLDTLGIACHGWEDTVADRLNRQSIYIGGFGLELCREGLGLWSVRTCRIIKGTVEKVIIYSCSAAETHPDPFHSTYIRDHAEGQRLMSEIAFYTGAKVYAADATQYSDQMADESYDLGHWYGNVYEFNPETGNSEIIQSYPRK